jgi:hypothetical protein
MPLLSQIIVNKDKLLKNLYIALLISLYKIDKIMNYIFKK